MKMFTKLFFIVLLFSIGFVLVEGAGVSLRENTLSFSNGGIINGLENLTLSGTIKSGFFIGDGSALTEIEGLWTNSSGDVTYSLGNVGIGTSSPTVALQVIGVIRASTSVNSAVFAEHNSASNAKIAMSNSNTMTFETGRTIAMHIDASQRVGIGTNTPGHKLEIVADGNPISATEQFTITGATDTNKRLRIGFDTTNNYGVIQALIFGTGFNDLALNPSGGNVGIGTTSPEALLHIEGSNAQIIISAISGGDADPSIIFKTNTGEKARVLYDESLAQLSLYVNGGHRLVVEDGGNVGIGTKTPEDLLHLKANGAVGLKLTAGESSIAQINFGDLADTNAGRIDFNNVENSFSFVSFDGSQDVRQMTILNSGKIGIGTATPQQELNVIGDLNVTGTIYGLGVNFSGNFVPYTGAISNLNLGTRNFITTGTLGSGKITVISSSAKIDLDGSGGITEISSGALLEIKHTRDISAPIIDFRGIPLNTISSVQFRFGLSSGSSGANEIILIASNSTTIASSIGTSFIDFNRNQANTDFRISSENNVNMFFLDASNDRIGINNINPFATLDVVGSFAVSGIATLGDGSLLFTSAAPTTDAMIANKKYVDDRVGEIVIPAIILPTKEFFIPSTVFSPLGEEGEGNNYPEWTSTILNKNKGVNFNFYVPSDFSTLTNIVMVIIPDTTETVEFDVFTSFAKEGEAYTTHTDSIIDRNQSVILDKIEELDISGAFKGIEAGDYVGVFFESDTSSIEVIGFRFKYS